MSLSKPFSLIKPTIDTPFHIDFKWWANNDSNWRVYLINFLCPEHQKLFADVTEDTWIDWVDPDTAEVSKVNGLHHVLMTHCVKQPDFIPENCALVEAVFRVFLANGNVPLTPQELSVKINKPAHLILKTLGGYQVYKGIRPVTKKD